MVCRLGRNSRRYHSHRIQLAVSRPADRGTTAPSARRLSAGSESGRPLGLPYRELFFNLQPILAQAQNQGRRVFLLAHSMGNFAWAAAVESWFSHSNPAMRLFDEVFLAAADERWDSFSLPLAARVSRISARELRYITASETSPCI